MSWPAALLTRRRRVIAIFVMAELTLAMAIPFLAISGYHTLLGSQAGTFLEEPSAGEPGWRALVDPSSVTAVVETDGGSLTGISLLVGPLEDESSVDASSLKTAGADQSGGSAGSDAAGPGGTVVVVPGTLVVDGSALAAREPAEAVAALETMLRLNVDNVQVVDEARWADILGAVTYRLANPDPVVDDDGQPLLEVGEIDVGAAEAAAFLGRPAPDSDPITLLFRRQLYWSALVEQPPSGADPVAGLLRSLAGPAAQVVILPLVDVVADPEPDLVASEALIRDVVPIPSGANPGDRLQVRVIDRTGVADLESVAAAVASTGSEVVEIGYAQEFDGGLTHLVVPSGLTDEEITELAAVTGATTVLDNDVEADAVVTLLVGSDYGVASS